MLRYLLRGVLRSGLAATALALFIASPLFAQSTGKVQGRVTDAATGAPIAGAQVRIANTTLGNITNDQGFYFINEVTAGLQDIEASFIGYRPVVVEGERILAAQTTTINFELEQTAVELEAITVEGERNPLVPRDQTATKNIVQGEAVDQLPLDNASTVVSFSPGVVQTNSGRSFRGSRANEEAVMIDGVLTRQFGTGTADNVDVPTNALEQVDVTVGAFAAEYGEAQSGLVNYVTRTGGTRFTGSLEYQTDQLTPNDSWRTNFNRFEATLGGPIFGPLSFFLAGTAQGRDRFLTELAPERFMIDGVEACPEGSQYAGFCSGSDSTGVWQGDPVKFILNRGSAANGAADYVEIAAPNYTPWDNGRTDPTGSAQVDLFTGNLNWQLPRGSRINFSYTRNRNQSFGRDGSLNYNAIYNPDDISGNLNVEQIFTLGTFLTLIQSADQQLALDLKASYGMDRGQFGLADYGWWQDNRDPFMGFAFSNVEFALRDVYGSDNPTITGFDWFDPSDELINAYRSNGIPRDSMRAFPQRSDIDFSQGIAGRSDPFRYNPYGFNTAFPFTGFDNDGWQKISEDRLALRGALDWQIGRFNRVKIGGEWTDVDLRVNNITLYEAFPLPEKAQPTRAGAFIQDRLDIGDLVLEGGVRWDYLDPDVQYPRTPAYVFSVPDSLKKDFVIYNADAGGYVPLNACGPDSDNPNGACLNNFIDAETKSEFSPRLGASFPVTPTSTFRLSYGRFVQTPAFYTSQSFASGDAGVGNQNVGFMQDVNLDRAVNNTNATYGRDVDMPSTRTFEFGYRQLIGSGTVIDLSAFNKKARNQLASRKLPFEDPIDGRTIYYNVVTNRDFSETNGFEIKLDQAISNLFTGNLSYTFLDAKGTGSDPFAYENLILRATTNLETLTGVPTLPPEALLTLEQSRKHNIALTTSLQFPRDWQEGTISGAIFRDLGLFTVLSVRSGLPYTKLVNSGNGEVGPPSGTFAGVPETSIAGNTTPWVWAFDLRLTKGFQLGQSFEIQAFLDWRNPLNLKTSTQVFLETAATVNEQFRDEYLSSTLRDDRLDGSNDVKGFDILAESGENNDFNRYMLLRAEDRWGNGDGFFSLEEQNRSFGQLYEDVYGQDVAFETSDQQFRLGLRLAFF